MVTMEGYLDPGFPHGLYGYRQRAGVVLGYDRAPLVRLAVDSGDLGIDHQLESRVPGAIGANVVELRHEPKHLGRRALDDL